MTVLLPAGKGSIMVVRDKKEITDGKDSYDAKMKPVLENLQPTLLIRAGEPWDITDKISRKECKTINEIVQRWEISQERVKSLA